MRSDHVHRLTAVPLNLNPLDDSSEPCPTLIAGSTLQRKKLIKKINDEPLDNKFVSDH